MKKFLSLFVLIISLFFLIYNFKENNESERDKAKKLLPKSIRTKISIRKTKALDRALNRDSYLTGQTRPQRNKELTPTQDEIRRFKEAFKIFEENPQSEINFLDLTDLKPSTVNHLLQKTFKNLLDCLAEGCDERPSEEGFFDINLTASVSTMIRVLEISDQNRETLNEGKWPKINDYLSLLEMPGPTLRETALKQLFKNYPKEALRETVKHLDLVNDDAVGPTLKVLVPHLDESSMESFIVATKQRYKISDTFVKTEILKNLSGLELNQRDIEEFASTECSIVDQPAGRSISYSLKELSKKNEKKFNLASFCNGN